MATLNGATISTERLDKTPRFHRNPPEKKSREKRGTLQEYRQQPCFDAVQLE